MAIRRLNKDRFERGDLARATVSTLPTVKAMRDCFERYLNLTIADGQRVTIQLKPIAVGFINFSVGVKRENFILR